MDGTVGRTVGRHGDDEEGGEEGERKDEGRGWEDPARNSIWYKFEAGGPPDTAQHAISPSPVLVSRRLAFPSPRSRKHGTFYIHRLYIVRYSYNLINVASSTQRTVPTCHSYYY